MSNTKLLPCPFCGEEKNIYLEKYEHAAGERWRIFCAECMAQIDRGYDQIQYGVIEAWNTRKPMDRIVEQLEQQAKQYKRRALELVEKSTEAGIHNKGKACSYEHAIDIVKAGGVE